MLLLNLFEHWLLKNYTCPYFIFKLMFTSISLTVEVLQEDEISFLMQVICQCN